MIPNGDSRRPRFAASAPKIAFQSRATNLAQGTTDTRTQIFLADLDTGEIEKVSLSSTGEASNGDCAFASPTADATQVVFQSDASNLVPGDENSFEDVFIRDLRTGETELVSVGLDGEEGDSASLRPSVSHDGTRVAFASRAKNLVVGDTSYRQDIFVRDLEKGETVRVNLGLQGEEANGYSGNPLLSGNGRFVVYRSEANNLVPNDNNGMADIFVHDLQAQSTERVNLGLGGRETNGKTYEATISDDGRYVAFYSRASNLVAEDENDHLDVFVRDRVLKTTQRVSLDHQGREIEGASIFAKISGDGSAVAFVSGAPGITPKEGYGYNDVFVRDIQSAKTYKASVGSNGARSKAGSSDPILSTDGQTVAFASWASNLVDESSRTRSDIYIHKRDVGTTERVSQPNEG